MNTEENEESRYPTPYKSSVSALHWKAPIFWQTEVGEKVRYLGKIASVQFFQQFNSEKKCI